MPKSRPPLDIAKVREELRAAAELDELAVGSVGALVNQRARQAWVDLGQRVPDLLAEVEELRAQAERVRAVLADWSHPRRHMSASHPMAELLDRLNEALSEPAPQTKGEGRG